MEKVVAPDKERDREVNIYSLVVTFFTTLVILAVIYFSRKLFSRKVVPVKILTLPVSQLGTNVHSSSSLIHLPTKESKESKDISTKRTVRVGRLENFPPFWYENGNKNGDKGIDYDVATEILGNLQDKSGNYLFDKIEFITYQNVEELYDELENCRIDMIINNLWATPGRMEEFNFTLPYSYQDGIVMTFKKENAGTYRTAEDLKGRVVGVSYGGDEKNWLPPNIGAIKKYHTVEELVKVVVNNDVDAAIEGFSSFFVVDKNLRDKTKTVVLQNFPSSIALRKNETLLTEELNNTIKKLWNDSTFYWIKSKYLPEYAIESYNYSPYHSESAFKKAEPKNS
jgi:cystine transport system substrate-binding protein